MFNEFKKSLNKRLDFLIKNGPLFIVDIEREVLWDTYINSFTPELNPIYLTQTIHNCNCCKSWIKHYAGIVGIIDDKIVSIWNIEDINYQPVINTMKKLVENSTIKDVFFTSEIFGTDHNVGNNPHKMIDNGDGTYTKTEETCPKFGKRFDHFYYKFPLQFISPIVDAKKGAIRQSKEVIERSFKELTDEALETVIELIETKTLYRGEEHLERLSKFYSLKKQWNNSELFCWLSAVNSGRLAAIRNSAIGTLLINLSEEMDLELAVKKYESVVAPTNYKRSKAIYTAKMKQAAEAKVIEMGLMDSLSRRFATLEDIHLDNVIWASGESQKVMKSAFDILPEINFKDYSHVSEIGIEQFISNVLPSASKVELKVENKHQNNFVSLITGKMPSLFQWDNPFSWDYNGGVTDSIRDAVIAEGGNVNGILNFRLAWNQDGGTDQSDLDAWALEPSGNKIGYSTFRGKGRFSKNSGNLDVDNRSPGNKIAVENITWSNKDKMQDGIYKLWVNQYNSNNSKGFTAQVEFNGEIHTFVYNKPVRGNVQVATVNLKNGKFSIKGAFKSEQSSKEIWNIETQQFIEIDTIMFSPNYWGYNKGNKHYFFFIKNCINNSNNSAKGFYNEFLKNEFRPDRKVFEALGAKMRVPESEKQLSGLGFSSTLNNSITIKVDGKPLKINFNVKSTVQQMEV